MRDALRKRDSIFFSVRKYPKVAVCLTLICLALPISPEKVLDTRTESQLPELAGKTPKIKLKILDRFLKRDPSASDEGSALYFQGRILERMKDEKKAIDKYEKAASGRSPLWEYAVQRLALLAESEDEKKAEELWLKLFNSAPNPSFRLKAASRLLALARKNKENTKAAVYAEVLYRNNPDDPARASLAADLLTEAGKEDKALPIVEKLYSRFAGKKESDRFFQKHRKWSRESTDFPNNLKLLRLRNMAHSGSRRDFQRELSRFKPTNETERGWVKYLKGRLAERKHSYHRARSYYFKVKTPADASMSSIVRLGYLGARGHLHRRDLKRVEKALANLPLSYRYRNGPLIALMRRFAKKKQDNETIKMAEAVLAAGQPSRIADAYLIEKGWDFWLDGDVKHAEKLWRKLIKHLPAYADDRLSASYTLMRLGMLNAKEKSEVKKSILKEDTYGYYGYSIRNGPPKLSRKPPEPPRILDKADVGSHALKGILLMRGGYYTEALREFHMETERSPRLLWTICTLLSKNGDYRDAILSARKLYPKAYSNEGRRVPEEAWEIIFPLAYRKEITNFSKKTGIPESLTASIIRQESLWDRMAVSRSGARGLMQLMYGTARHVARKEGIHVGGRYSLHDPSLNILLGSSYMKRLISRYNGRIYLALAAYNAGPSRVNAWLNRKNCPKSRDLFIESIPFRETRRYVRRILLNMEEYTRIYPELAKSSTGKKAA